MKEYEKRHLEACIKTMEEACQEARRRWAEEKTTLDAAEEILHVFAWGWANASTGLSTAIRAVQREFARAAAKPPQT